MTESNNITLLYPEQQKPRAGADEQAVYLPTKKTKKRDQEKTKKKPPTTTAEVAALLLVLCVRRAVIARTQSVLFPTQNPRPGKQNLKPQVLLDPNT
jgi:hypothetical protein